MDAGEGVEDSRIGVPVGAEADEGKVSHVLYVAPRSLKVEAGGQNLDIGVYKEDHQAVIAGRGGAARFGTEGEQVAGIDSAKVEVAVGGGVDHLGVAGSIGGTRVGRDEHGVASCGIEAIGAIASSGVTVPVDSGVGDGLPVVPFSP